MLLRKPFAILIKYFKLIHLILTAMIVFSVIKTNSIFRFIGEYISSNTSTTVTHVVDQLFSPLMFVVIIGILVGSLIILGLMSFKKKPIGFYIYNIITYIFVTGVFIYAYSIIRTMEVGLVDVRTLKVIRDLLMVSLSLQAVSLLTVSIRATGFNIKKFDFDADLEDLQIAEEDNEEFEVDVELDTDRFRRNVKKKFRHAKYVYIENKFIINLLVLLLVAGIFYLIYLNTGVYEKMYQQKEAFTTTEYMMNITGSYITNVNYHGDSITNNTLVVIEYQVRNVYQVNKKIMKPGRFQLRVQNSLYRQTEEYSDQLYDLGSIYRNEYMTTDFQTFIMVYEIPKELAKQNMVLQYEDRNHEFIEIAIEPIDDNKKITAGSYTINQSFDMTDPIMKNTVVKIESYDVQDSFQHPYTYCLDENNCQTGTEYIFPSATGNYDKTLLKLTGNITLADELTINNPLNLYILMRDFGTIYYDINGETKKMHFNFQQVKPSKSKTDNTIYLEVLKELKDAEKIIITFTIRDQIYEIVVK